MLVYKMIIEQEVMFIMLVVEEAHVGPVVLVVLEAKVEEVTARAQHPKLLLQLIPAVVLEEVE